MVHLNHNVEYRGNDLSQIENRPRREINPCALMDGEQNPLGLEFSSDDDAVGINVSVMLVHN